jgi:ATP-dependent protease Clp ATPase subunit
MDNDDKTKHLTQNSALYCCVCLSSTEKLESQQIVALRVVDPKDNKTISICKECLSDLNRKFYTESKSKINFNKKTTRIKNTINEEQVTPSYIYQQLDKYVMGQSEAKKSLSLAVATHLKRIDDPSIEKK